MALEKSPKKWKAGGKKRAADKLETILTKVLALSAENTAFHNCMRH